MLKVFDGKVVTNWVVDGLWVNYVTAGGESKRDTLLRFKGIGVDIDEKEWSLYVEKERELRDKWVELFGVEEVLARMKGVGSNEDHLLHDIVISGLGVVEFLSRLTKGIEIRDRLKERSSLLRNGRVPDDMLPYDPGEFVYVIDVKLFGDKISLLGGKGKKIEWIYSRSEIMMRVGMGVNEYKDLVLRDGEGMVLAFSGHCLTVAEEQTLIGW